jgi:flagellar basal body-associated protein FliL
MEDKNASRSRNIWIAFLILLLIVSVAVALVVPVVSDTTKLLCLGGGLLVIGVWGRRKLSHD